MRTPRLPAVDRTDAPTDLNGLVRFGERRNLVYARVPSRSARAIRLYETIQHIKKVCKIHPVMVCHIKTDIPASVNNNKLYLSFQYMLRGSVVLTILRNLNT